MRVLHLFGNFKLTGPAEPAVRLAQHLARRGLEVSFSHMPAPAGLPAESGSVAAAAAAAGLRVVDGLRLPKHFDARALWHDARTLARHLDAERIDVIHVHGVNDHLTAVLARARARAKPALVRTNHEAVPLGGGLRNRFLFPKRVDALVELSARARDADLRRFGLAPGRVHVVDAAVDLARFDPGRALPDLRARWGLGVTDFVVGIAARVQQRRRFDVLLAAVQRARAELPGLRLVVIGRGTHRESVAIGPARALGLDDVTHFPGYLRGDDYVGALAALDVKLFLFPGTDGSCRAAREAMALGRPVVASRLGMLPELVRDGHDGLLVELAPEPLAGAIVRLGRDPALRRRLGEQARRTALARFDPARQAAAVEGIYREVFSPGTG